MKRIRRRRAEINIVPLVDVLIVLIFFFLIAMEFRRERILNITLPKIETAGQNKPAQNIEIAISPTDEFYYNGSLVAKEEIAVLLRTSAAIDRSQTVLIVADEDAMVKNMTYVMDVCRQVGLESIRIQSR